MSLFGKTLCLVHPIIIYNVYLYLYLYLYLCVCVYVYLRTCVRVDTYVCVCVWARVVCGIVCVFISSSLWFNSVFTNLSALPYWWVSRWSHSSLSSHSILLLNTSNQPTHPHTLIAKHQLDRFTPMASPLPSLISLKLFPKFLISFWSKFR